MCVYSSALKIFSTTKHHTLQVTNWPKMCILRLNNIDIKYKVFQCWGSYTDLNILTYLKFLLWICDESRLSLNV